MSAPLGVHDSLGQSSPGVNRSAGNKLLALESQSGVRLLLTSRLMTQRLQSRVRRLGG